MGEPAASQAILETIVRALVERPEQVEVERFDEEDGSVLLELSVAQEDLGRVIGRGGRTANALRAVVRAAAVRDERRVLVDIVE